jgi:hypothetical protein
MTRGIQLKELSATDLGYLGLPPATLQGAIDMIEGEICAYEELSVETLAVARDVRSTLEEVLTLLTEALPVDCR